MPSLHWIGKEKVINHHHDVPYRVLDKQYTFSAEEKPVNEPEIFGKANKTQPKNPSNLIIHGDNLEALKALLPQYEGKVKCIYIDPPYNTGNESWVYNDNVNDPKLKKWLGQVVGKESEDLSRHDKWLCMMYPRLVLLYRLLANDGSVWISIDDNEYSNLKLICDEIFGGNNFISNIIWQKNYSPKNSAKHFSVDHDSILVYGKNGELWRPNLMSRNAEQISRYKNPDNDNRGPWKPGDLSARNFYSLGTYPIKTPSGRIIEGPPKGNYWRYSEEKLWDLHNDNRIWWGKNGNGVPAIKRFLSEVQGGIVPQTLWFYNDVGHTQDAKKEVNKVLHDVETFATPKPSKLIERILQLAAGENDIVLDSFAGSGTTAHAVLNLNKLDGGSRKFILVEMEDYAETITAERVRRVMNGYADKEGTGGSFDYYTLGERLFDDSGNLNPAVPTNKIRQYIWFTETKGTSLPLPDEHQPEPYRMGVHEGTAYYFCYNAEATTTLDYDLLGTFLTRAEQYIVYADSCLLPDDYLQQKQIIFKKIPRDITRL
ncbi:site-specific DNA-methyltransferase [Fibrella arboris]|uniref:site-specific DNA-methyltransferase n=1 Tax=Fibrella arboris TaxID=3242486 RepID=UPI00352130B6